MADDTSTPSIEAAPFAQIETMIRAFSHATDPEERTLYLRGIARALEYVTGKTHAALVALTEAVRS